MRTIVTVIGARPQFIKAAVVSRCLREYPQLREIVVHTGQHYDTFMNQVFFEELEMPPPDYQLGVGSGSQGQQTGQMLERLERVLLEVRPDWVLVYGDTNSTLAGALSAAKIHIPVAHVEAGLRSFNRQMPEEINRIVTDHLSSILFAPTQVAVQNLQREGIPQEQIVLVGDVMYDAALIYAQKAQRCSTILHRLNLSPGDYCLATIHRAENTDDPQRLRVIFEALRAVAHQLQVVIPLHPRTYQRLDQYGLLSEISASPVRLINPVGYLDMVQLERHAAVIVTDSGGVQKEAFFYGVPCVTVREETEWVELLQLGWNRLAPPHSASVIVSTVLSAIGIQGVRSLVYGRGDAAPQIAEWFSAN